MTMHINFIQRRCLLCGRHISVPNFSRHLEACERKHAAIKAERQKGTPDVVG